MEIFTHDGFIALLQVLAIDLVLAGDNAIVIGLAAAGLPKEQRNKAILIGIAAATVMRIGFALIATWLLHLIGILIAGGILLLWVSWKMWRELRADRAEREARAADALIGDLVNGNGNGNGGAPAVPRKTLRQAAMQIVVADISMSLDNVLAVAGAAKDHPTVLVLGLGMSIILMGLAAGFIARLLNRFRWIAYIGLAIILYVAVKMVWDGWHQVAATGIFAGAF